MKKEISKALRKIRVIDAEVKLYVVAKALGVTSTYLSEVETGKRSVTSSFLNKALKYYESLYLDVNEIQRLAAPDITEVKIDVAKMSDQDRVKVMGFAREFPDWDEPRRRALWKFLESTSIIPI